MLLRHVSVMRHQYKRVVSNFHIASIHYMTASVARRLSDTFSSHLSLQRDMPVLFRRIICAAVSTAAHTVSFSHGAVISAYNIQDKSMHSHTIQTDHFLLADTHRCKMHKRQHSLAHVAYQTSDQAPLQAWGGQDGGAQRHADSSK